jgi:TRAP-type transport system periplasmic protein
MPAPVAVRGEPIKLKLAFFGSDRTHLYRSIVKPFVDAVNAEGRGMVEIDAYLSGDPAA